jgi:hypothetical protein
VIWHKTRVEYLHEGQEIKEFYIHTHMVNGYKNFHTSVNKSCTVIFFGHLRFTCLLGNKRKMT